jgi:hypothetical protein
MSDKEDVLFTSIIRFISFILKDNNESNNLILSLFPFKGEWAR